MKLLSLEPIVRGEWVINGSILGREQILICMFNTYTFETYVKAFTDEMDANLTIEYILNRHLLKDELNDE